MTNPASALDNARATWRAIRSKDPRPILGPPDPVPTHDDDEPVPLKLAAAAPPTTSPDAIDAALAQLASALPPILYRDHPKFYELTGYTRRSMSNKDSRGQGPAGRVVLGRRVGYPRAELLAWLRARMSAATTRPRPAAFDRKGA